MAVTPIYNMTTENLGMDLPALTGTDVGVLNADLKIIDDEMAKLMYKSAPYIADLNTVDETRVNTTTSTTLNKPDEGYNFTVFSVRRTNSTEVTQLAVPYAGASVHMFFRAKRSGGWTAWSRVTMLEDFVGASVNNVNANDYMTPGVYYLRTGCTNVPGTYIALKVIALDTGAVYQHATRFVTGGTYESWERCYGASTETWTPWMKIVRAYRTGESVDTSGIICPAYVSNSKRALHIQIPVSKPVEGTISVTGLTITVRYEGTYLLTEKTITAGEIDSVAVNAGGIKVNLTPTWDVTPPTNNSTVNVLINVGTFSVT